ncbi:fatty acyl-AMP ligase [Azospirillum picis]|uniref:Fatty-acyl-CoA synthase n=1 Tax=Azospirillum picis TaxID=488438 RepID=A0ABU0MNX2_9PROT|nr:fatty acyl-AMP ligase [Azospirillum picis]MBP2301135.1 fatty-acyl-CoA synthase [Azospirillum picis]MDQ0534903.1 fatty-acyl-CoA synthase [Azospirillum picis]
MPEPTPTICPLPTRAADFATLPEALDYAAGSSRGLNFYSGRGQLEEALSYRDLREQAVSLARRMLGAGFVPGERVAIVAETDGDFVRTFCACSYAGLVPVPMPLPMPFGRGDAYVAHLRGMIETAQASGVLAPPSLSGWINEAAQGLTLRVAGSLSSLEALADHEGPLPAVADDDVAYLQFSSGSTRFPVGVTVTHRNLMANARAISLYGLQITRTDRCVSWLPFYHDMGLVGFLLTPLLSQISVDYLATREFARRPLTWLSLIARNRGTLSYSPSFGFELCARRASTATLPPLDLSSWRAAGIGGDMIRPHVLEEFARTFAPHGFSPRAFVPSYGMAETVLAISFAPLDTGVVVDRVDLDLMEEGIATPAGDGARARDFVRCGPPLPGHEAEIRGADGTALPDRALGRIFLRGPSVMRDYFDRPDETARVLSADGWLDTGDLGFRVDGQLVITGRAKDVIIVNGRNIWPQDLEWSAEQVEGLRSGDAAAFAVDDGGSERIVVLVECRKTDPAERSALAAAVAAALRDGHGADAGIVLVPPRSLPQTSSGKLSRNKARQLYLSGAFGEGQ